ncbi:hypothetical protein BWR15_06005 [Pseudomonas sp. T]|uniref:Transcriptional regulator n=1 Tax=Pseudomonas nitroreducens TaxID=46680 RepID=A0A5R8ZWW5_PSENT|nr:helix-turn-helix domain-containing protein [Pseudomonas nitroreducens]OQR35880.1 hypothetical protein BWR15_06005 [Pseudomonas sp. T]TLP70780.1 transcriptional regulator [Pseudomonas nitroreducens]
MNTAEIPKDIFQRWEWIKYQLRAKGSSLAILARELDLTGSAVKNAKRRPYPHVERAIAQKLGLQAMEIWPERWASNDEPYRQRPNRAESAGTTPQKHNAGCAEGHRKTGTEA